METGGMSSLSTEVVAERLAQVRDRMDRAGAAPGSVKIVAVTKGFGPAAVEAAVGAGVEDLGENYAHELLAKAAPAPPATRWHFLGQLQRNKLARLAPLVYLWHSLDSEAAALALARRRPGASVLVQVRVSGAAPRLGVDPNQVPTLVSQAAAAGLQVKGLMAVGPRSAAGEHVRQCFREVARLARSLGLAELSMGMSGDFELAVAEGATIVRLGRALFGDRPIPTRPQGARGGAPSR
jgi:pyridoxal phosphate enzyme (YggS family)